MEIIIYEKVSIPYTIIRPISFELQHIMPKTEKSLFRVNIRFSLKLNLKCLQKNIL